MKKWFVKLEDAGDGSGDAILNLPPDLCESLGWTEGTQVSMNKDADGSITVCAAQPEHNLPRQFVRDTLQGMAEADSGKLKPYKKG